MKAIVKKSLLYVPGLGMIFYASEYLFLDRKWAADQPKMTAMVKQSRQFPYPISVSYRHLVKLLHGSANLCIIHACIKYDYNIP